MYKHARESKVTKKSNATCIKNLCVYLLKKAKFTYASKKVNITLNYIFY